MYFLFYQGKKSDSVLVIWLQPMSLFGNRELVWMMFCCVWTWHCWSEWIQNCGSLCSILKLYFNANYFVHKQQQVVCNILSRFHVVMLQNTLYSPFMELGILRWMKWNGMWGDKARVIKSVNISSVSFKARQGFGERDNAVASCWGRQQYISALSQNA